MTVKNVVLTSPDREPIELDASKIFWLDARIPYTTVFVSTENGQTKRFAVVEPIDKVRDERSAALSRKRIAEGGNRDT